MKRVFTAICLLASAFALSEPASAQPIWPNKPIKLIVPYAAGGYTDIVGRITARYLEKEFGYPAIIENRAGAGGIVGTDVVSKSDPDGYTLCVCSIGAISVAPVVQAVQYDPLKDLTPIAMVSTITQMVIVKNALPVHSMKDLVAYAKANPDKLSYASSGAGGLMYFSAELFQMRTGTKLVHVPFRGGAPATMAVVSGDVDLTFTNLTDALPQVQGNTVRSLAVTSLERSPFAPDVPTIAETVQPGFNVATWNAIMGPRNMPDAITQRIAAVLDKMGTDSEVKSGMEKVGATLIYVGPNDFRKAIIQEIEQWRALLKEDTPK
ncbi:MAG TPA: tripartite tricarboxylate transporter substrate binding protein [Beijerinckiaceae bacterium]|nr:tripartite tricarboxylate transporter substrate binding protein [Beijerinckiaceae bacterium]